MRELEALQLSLRHADYLRKDIRGSLIGVPSLCLGLVISLAEFQVCKIELLKLLVKLLTTCYRC